MRTVVALFCVLTTSACSMFPLGAGDDTTAPPPGGDGGTSDAAQGSTATTLAVDCRVGDNIHKPQCVSPTLYDGSQTIGAGPHFVGTLDQVNRGFVDGNRLIAGMSTQAGGQILAVDLTSGDRKLISGPGVGTGTALPSIFDVQPGPDGWYALGNTSVWRVDPATGNRTKVWDTTMSATDCKFLPSTEIGYGGAGGGIAVASDGTIYLPITTSAGNEVGAGLVAVKGTTCKLVSHSGWPTTSNKGTGPIIIAHQMFMRGSELLALDATAVVATIDPVTGNRTVVSNHSVGSGETLGGNSMAPSVDGKSAWTACSYSGGGVYVDVDLATGNRTDVDPYVFTPLSIGGPWCTVWQHPTQPLLIVEEAKGFVLFEPSTGNSNVLSY